MSLRKNTSEIKQKDFKCVTYKSIFNTNDNQRNSNLFFGDGIAIARYDQLQYPQLDKITDKQLGFFWRPEEVDLGRDRLDFKSLTDSEQHIFTSNLKRQIVLDSIQGRAPTETLLNIASVPELEPLLLSWGFFETLHSRSYTHIIRNVYADPTEIFDKILETPAIVECADDITRDYDDFIEYSKWYQMLGLGNFVIEDQNQGKKFINIDMQNIKKKLWRVLHAINVLEGIRFYVSFACSWNFAEQRKMEGNAKIIKFIARDENLHLAITQHLIKILLKSDDDFKEINESERDNITELFVSGIEQEKKWSEYLFQDGSMLGLNHQVLCDYIEWIGAKRMKSMGLQVPYSTGVANPLPWTARWISGQDVQVAPQEAEISSYQVGAVKNDLDKNFFKNLEF